MSKLHIKKGDTVYVNSGEDKGKTGRVLKVLVKEGRALVEGINMVSKSTKPNAKNPQGGIVKQEAAIHISNLNVLILKQASQHVWEEEKVLMVEHLFVMLKNQERRLNNE